MSAPSAGISIREFAKRDGCDEKLVRGAVKSGRLARFRDGSLDPALVGSPWRQTNRRRADKSADTFSEDPPRLSAGRDLAPALTALSEDLTYGIERDLTSFIDQLLNGSYHSEADAITVKENGLALKHMIEARKRAGEVVEIEVARTILFETFRSARDAWMNWPGRVGPLIAAELGIDAEKVTEALTSHVHQQLNDLGDEPDIDFTGGEKG